MSTHPTDNEIVRALGPWHRSMAGIAKDAEDRVLSAIAILGLPRLTERAGDFHRALRNLFRSWCDETNDLFRMIEERDGLGLDCMVCNLITGKPYHHPLRAAQSGYREAEHDPTTKGGARARETEFRTVVSRHGRARTR